MRLNVLLYLLPPSPSQEIYWGFLYIEASIDDQLKKFSRILHGLDQSSTFDALHKAYAKETTWQTEGIYDTVNPFGDKRQCFFDAKWTFDIEHDILFLTNSGGRSTISLSLLREYAIKVEDMNHLGPPFPVPPAFKLDGTYWRPSLRIDKKVSAYVGRLLRDFDHQWRHILRNEYNFTTLRHLAQAIIRLSALDFDIFEETRARKFNPRPKGEHVGVLDLPTWEPFESDSDIVLAGSVHVVLCQSIHDGLSEAHQHAYAKQHTSDQGSMDLCYLILSVKHIMLGRITEQLEFEHTAPEPFLNGDPNVSPPSALALDYIVWATATSRKFFPTSLRRLPVEIQDIILDYSSAGTVNAAKLGCLLDIGSPFLWKDGNLDVMLREYYRHRIPTDPVESQINFDGQPSGLVYRGEGPPGYGKTFKTTPFAF